MLTLERLRIAVEDFRLDADLSVATGGRVAVLGPSGAGKSTLLAAIAGFLAPVEGRILWQAQDLQDLRPGQRPISMLFQDNNLFPHLSAAQNVGLGLRPDLRLGREGWARVEASLARVGLAGIGSRKPGALSGGEATRVALARMLLRGRPLVLLDEPFAALGPALKEEMLALVGALADEIDATLLMITHEPRDAEAIAGSTVVVADGQVSAPRPTAALLADPPAALAAYLGRGGALRRPRRGA